MVGHKSSPNCRTFTKVDSAAIETFSANGHRLMRVWLAWLRVLRQGPRRPTPAGGAPAFAAVACWKMEGRTNGGFGAVARGLSYGKSFINVDLMVGSDLLGLGIGAVSSYLGGRLGPGLFVKNDEVNGDTWGYGGNITMGDITVCFDRGKMVDFVTHLVKTCKNHSHRGMGRVGNSTLQPAQFQM